MKKELEEECNCHCGDHCDCGNHCDCGSDLPALEEKLLLLGLEEDKNTKEAMKILKEKDVDYEFVNINKLEEEALKDAPVPTLLLIKTVIGGVAPGLDGIKEALK